MLGLSLVAVSGGSFIAVHGFHIVMTSLVVEPGHASVVAAQRLSSWGSQALEYVGFQSCGSWALVALHVACGIFPDRGSNLCRLHWQAESYPRYHQSTPQMEFTQS